jgi:hypothetical protein
MSFKTLLTFRSHTVEQSMYHTFTNIKNIIYWFSITINKIFNWICKYFFIIY